jgi:xanthine dehydrogenase accessory factor
VSQWTLWLRDIAQTRPAALVSVLATAGSAPRGAGTRMLVTAGEVHGTIGGGALEFRAIDQARAILSHPPGTWRMQDYPLGPLLGQCCGGRVRLLVEHVDAAALDWLRDVADATPRSALVSTLGPGRIVRYIVPDTQPVAVLAGGPLPVEGAVLVERIAARRRPLYLFGAGHVGQAIAHHVTGLPFTLAWFDTREEQAGIDGVVVMSEDEIAHCVEEAPTDAAIVILTHDHGLDYGLALAALKREQPVEFVGLIGSRTKKARFYSRFERDGVTPEALARMHCPIGLEGVSGKEPDVIAISILAQLLSLSAA